MKRSSVVWRGALFWALVGVTAAAEGEAQELDQDSIQELANPGPEHALLQSMAGEWDVTATILSGAGDANPARGRAVAQPLLGGRFTEVKLDLPAGVIREAHYIFGFDRRHGMYTVMSMDNTGTYAVWARGERDGDRIAMYGSDDEPMMTAMGLDKEFAIVLEVHSADHFRIEIRFIDTRTPARTEIPFMAFDLKRAGAGGAPGD